MNALNKISLLLFTDSFLQLKLTKQNSQFMKKITLIMGLTLITMLSGYSQDYNTAIGIRGGFFNGVTFKHFTNNSDAFEIIASTHYRGFLVAGMFQRHANAFDAPGLNWYYGAGAHVGVYERRNTPWFKNESGSVSTLGINGVFGLEYKIEEVPITIGVDITPAFNIIGHTGFWINSGIALRYVLR